MFGKVISPVGGTWVPKDVILPLLLAITEPVEMHIHSLGSFLLDSVIDDTTGSVVVGLQRASGLRMPQFF